MFFGCLGDWTVVPMKKLNDFQTKKYQVIKNVIPKDFAKFGTQALLFSENDYLTKNNMRVDSDNQVPVMKFYAHSVTESFMVFLLPKIEKIVGEKLVPTYSYARVYRNGSILKEHRDRPSCEVSISIQMASEGVKNENGWGITMGEETIYLANSDGVVYNGLKVPHKRDELFCEPNGFQVQMFCHYVKANGRFSRWAYDKRVGPGITG